MQVLLQHSPEGAARRFCVFYFLLLLQIRLLVREQNGVDGVVFDLLHLLQQLFEGNEPECK